MKILNPVIVTNSSFCGGRRISKNEEYAESILKGFLIISSVQSLICVRLFATPWTTACQASLAITNSWSLPKFMSIESVMPSNHLILCCPLLLPSVFPGIRVFSDESALHIRWPKYWSFSFNTSPSNEHSGLISFRMDWFYSFIIHKDRFLTNSIYSIWNLHYFKSQHSVTRLIKWHMWEKQEYLLCLLHTGK